jgi:UDP-glucose 4-epimerase
MFIMPLWVVSPTPRRSHKRCTDAVRFTHESFPMPVIYNERSSLNLFSKLNNRERETCMHILVTGGAGYIGSHTCLELLQADYDVVVVDNLANSKAEPLRRVQALTGKTLNFEAIDRRDQAALDAVFGRYPIAAVIHFAGLKAVGESVTLPLHYYQNNVAGTLNLCEVMAKYQVKKLVFSSSCTVYGDPHTVPITEDFPLSATNPYGRSKLMIE